MSGEESEPVRRREDCPTCGLALYETCRAQAKALPCCAVAMRSRSHRLSQRASISRALAERLRRAGEVKFNEYLLRFKTGKFELTVFQDARSIIRGTDEIATARSLYAKYIGT